MVNSKDNNNTMASTSSAANNALASSSHSRSPVTTNDDRKESSSVGIENNSASNSFTSSTKLDATADAEHIRMRHSLSLIPDEEHESKEHEDIPTTASRVTALHLDTEQDENDSYFDDHHDYQTGTNDMLSPESQGTEDDFIKRIYETVDGPCHGVIPACQITIDQQLDLFTHCRHPSSFLSLFQERGDSRDGVEVLPPGMGMGMYVMPTFCEYCGAEHTNECNGSCERPVLYLQKKRPPFSKPSALWDPATDHAIPQKRDKNSVSQGRGSSPLRKSWVAGLFGKEK
jgi:hypothetical protein